MMLTIFEMEMDRLAKARTKTTGETYAKAFDEIVQENPHLYQRHNESLHRMGSRQVLEELDKEIAKTSSQTTKSDAVKAAEKALDEAAREVQKREGITYHAAYDRAVGERPDLYEQYLAASAQH